MSTPKPKLKWRKNTRGIIALLATSPSPDDGQDSLDPKTRKFLQRIYRSRKTTTP